MFKKITVGIIIIFLCIITSCTPDTDSSVLQEYISINLPVLSEETGIVTDFTTEACDVSVDPYNLSNMGVQNILWINNSTVQISAYISINCADTLTEGKYVINENVIALSYTLNSCQDTNRCMRCSCAQKVVYTIYDIEKQEYMFTIKPSGYGEMIDEYTE
ncbi:MAG: hypothetical protein WC254_05900 [Candidatus Woesearchaeota archaeon]|jgi:hypothetical protein